MYKNTNVFVWFLIIGLVLVSGCFNNPPQENAVLNKNKSVEQCIENWNCEEWSECIDYEQTRICTDMNKCGTILNRPDYIKKCGFNSCKTNIDCEDNDPCTEDICSGTPGVCFNKKTTSCKSGDGCCGRGCWTGNDLDCRPKDKGLDCIAGTGQTPKQDCDSECSYCYCQSKSFFSSTDEVGADKLICSGKLGSHSYGSWSKVCRAAAGELSKEACHEECEQCTCAYRYSIATIRKENWICLKDPRWDVLEWHNTSLHQCSEGINQEPCICGKYYCGVSYYKCPFEECPSSQDYYEVKYKTCSNKECIKTE